MQTGTTFQGKESPMSPSRRTFIKGFAVLQAMAAGGQTAVAAGFPERPIHFVVPFAAGGNADIVGRIMGEVVFAALKQPVVVDNKPGAGGAVGAELAARATADGYTMLVASNGPMTVNQFFNAKMPYDPFKDFVPVALSSYVPHVIAASNALGVSTVEAVVTKSRGGTINLGTSGIGSATHMTLERFKHASGANVTHVPYRGGGSLLPDVISGTLDGAVTELSTVMELHKAGKLKIIGVASEKRAPLVPDVPTFDEGGVKGFTAASYVGLVAPAKTAPEIIDAVGRAIAGGLAQGSAGSAKLLSQGSVIATAEEMTPTGFGAFLRREYEAMAAAAKVAGIVPG